MRNHQIYECEPFNRCMNVNESNKKKHKKKREYESQLSHYVVFTIHSLVIYHNVFIAAIYQI